MLSIINEVNLLAVLICVVLNNIMAIVWYMPFLFGKAYSRCTGLPVGGPPSPVNLATGIICNIVMVVALTILIKALGITLIKDALIFSSLVGIGIITTVNLPINRFNRYPLGLFYIDSGMPFVAVIIDSIVITLMK